MDNMLGEVISENASTDDQSGLPVLSSSVNLFGYIKQSVKRCTAYSTSRHLQLAKGIPRSVTAIR